MQFEVRGVDMRTGQAVTISVFSNTAEAARAMAQEQGVQVHSVRALDDAFRGPTASTSTYPASTHWPGVPRTSRRSTRSAVRDPVSIGQLFGAAAAGIMTLVLAGLSVVAGWKLIVRKPAQNWPALPPTPAYVTPAPGPPAAQQPVANAQSTLNYWNSLTKELRLVKRAPEQFKFDLEAMQRLQALSERLGEAAIRVRALEPLGVDADATTTAQSCASKVEAMKKVLLDAISPEGMRASGASVGKSIASALTDGGSEKPQRNYWEQCQDRFTAARNEILDQISTSRIKLSQKYGLKFQDVADE